MVPLPVLALVPALSSTVWRSESFWNVQYVFKLLLLKCSLSTALHADIQLRELSRIELPCIPQVTTKALVVSMHIRSHVIALLVDSKRRRLQTLCALLDGTAPAFTAPRAHPSNTLLFSVLLLHPHYRSTRLLWVMFQPSQCLSQNGKQHSDCMVHAHNPKRSCKKCTLLRELHYCAIPPKN